MTIPDLPSGTCILGVGIDLIEVSRVVRALERQGDRFRNRVFTEGELAYCDGIKFPGPHFAARFAAKEAVSKAFGTGIGEHMGWKTAEVVRDSLGKPSIRLDPAGHWSFSGPDRQETCSSASLTPANTPPPSPY